MDGGSGVIECTEHLRVRRHNPGAKLLLASKPFLV